MVKRNLAILKLIGLLAPFIALPYIVGEYKLSIMLIILLYFIVAVSFRLITTTGEYSFAHVVMMGLGGYTSALLARYFGLSFLVTLPLGGLAGVAFAAITAYPLFKMKGFYFFIGSFAIGEAMRLLWLRWPLLFGGANGIRNISRPTIAGYAFLTTFSYYWLTLVVVVLSLVVMYLIDRSRMGETLKAIKSQDTLAQSLGINIMRYKAIAYMTGSFFAGISGVLLGHYLGIVSPLQFAVNTMLYVLIWVLVGGMATFWGPLVGTFVLRIIEEILRGTMQQWTPMFYGLILIGAVLGLPDGLESIPGKIGEWWKSRRGQGKVLQEG